MPGRIIHPLASLAGWAIYRGQEYPLPCSGLNGASEMVKGPMVEVENAASPGHVYRVDAGKYSAMREAMLAVLPSDPPGMTVADVKTHVVPRLPEALFPGGAKAGWWIKCVQLDLEAKGLVKRSDKPVRLYLA